ncbi:SRPBCC family protein [Mycolicibacterium stellerae]|uniref:SRPBCC family protein n=1 Tax=Mycolicibacterium stellerae TaxID=2358193 RepID=UPI000F0B350E|nr:SRPBCC family protein [Mycolicibacterium stellerae]
MTDRGPASAKAEVTIDAEPATVYGLITNLPTLASLAEEAEAMKWCKGDGVAPGAVFKGTNRNGLRRWTTTCTVTDADPGRAFAFDVSYLGVPIAHWRYDITAKDGGCLVSEGTWDRRPGWMAKAGGLATGVSDRDTANDGHIRLTLKRLKERAEAG